MRLREEVPTKYKMMGIDFRELLLEDGFRQVCNVWYLREDDYSTYIIPDSALDHADIDNIDDIIDNSLMLGDYEFWLCEIHGV